MGKAGIPAPRLSSLPIKANPEPSGVKMRGRLLCEVWSCSPKPPPGHGTKGRVATRSPQGRGTKGQQHSDWAVTSDLHGPQPRSQQETSRQKPLLW